MPAPNDYPLLFLSQKKLERPETCRSRSLNLLFCLSGKIEIAQDDGKTEILPGDNLLLIRSDVSYTVTPLDSSVILHMGILPRFIEEYVCPEQQLFCDSVSEPYADYSRVKRLMTVIASEYLDYTQDHRLTIQGWLFHLADELAGNFRSRRAGTDSPEEYDSRMREIEDYVGRGYRGTLSLTDLAEHLHLTPQYVSKYMKRRFGMTFSAYLNRIRTESAMRELCHTGQGITETALSNGFSNVSTFNRHFRELYGMSPREFRAEHAAGAASSEELLPYSLQQDASSFFEVSPRRHVTADVGTYAPFTRNLCSLINIGQAINLIDIDFRRRLLTAHRALDFQYVRMENMISSSVILRIADTGQYSMAYPAEILDFLQHNGLVPFIELSRNSLHSLNTLMGISDAPQILRHGPAYLRQLEEFLRFAVNRYGQDWCDRWLFEFYKPASVSAELYAEEYRAVRSLVRSILPSASIGGPGFSLSESSDDFLVFLREMKNTGVLTDFLSMRFFAIQYESGSKGGSMNLSSASRSLERQLKWALQRLREIWGGSVPLYITEFNSCLLPDTYISATCFQAPFLCRSLLLMHEDAPLIGYWMLSDSAFTLPNRTGRMSAGVGLFDKSGIATPAFHALALLRKLGDRLVRQGEHYCINISGPDHYQVLAFHYAGFSDFSSMQSSEHRSFRNVYACFEDRAPVDMDFTLTGIRPGVYRIHRYLLDRMHGSVFDIRLGSFRAGNLDEDDYLNKTRSLSLEDREYLQKACVPEERTIYVTAGTELTLDIRLAVHNVCLWDIRMEM